MKFRILFATICISLSAFAQNIGIYPPVTATGTDTYVSDYTGINPAPTTYVNNTLYRVKFNNANLTTTPTWSFNSLASHTLTTSDGAALTVGAIKAGDLKIVSYDGTNFRIMGGGASTWGSIGGTLSDQTDLQNALNAKGSGTVTSASVTTANGVSGTVATATTTPAITLTLGAITPSSVNGVTVSGSSSPTLAVTGTTTVSGANTGDQTNITGNAGTATALATGRTISVTGDIAYTSSSFTGAANVTGAGTLATVNSNVGSFGSATQSLSATVNAKGLVTAMSAQTVTPAVGSITGLGTGIATLLAGNTSVSPTELNFVDNTTSGIQTQFDAIPKIDFAASDETTVLTTGTAKVTVRAPKAFTVTSIKCSLTTAQTSGSLLTIDINEAGTSIISTKITFDNTERDNTTAATAYVLSDSSIADFAEITLDIDVVGNGTATGLKCKIYGN